VSELIGGKLNFRGEWKTGKIVMPANVLRVETGARQFLEVKAIRRNDFSAKLAQTDFLPLNQRWAVQIINRFDG